jgi:septum formation inhibitor-activating ATPase MinD
VWLILLSPAFIKNIRPDEIVVVPAMQLRNKKKLCREKKREERITEKTRTL